MRRRTKRPSLTTNKDLWVMTQAEQDWLAAETEFLRVAPERRRWTDSIEVRAYWKYLARSMKTVAYAANFPAEE